MIFFRRPKSELFQLFIIAFIPVLVSFFLPADPGEAGYEGKFDKNKFQDIVEEKPDVVLIGNSMADTRVDLPLLNKLIKPNKASFLVEGGTRSTVWYFLLKNFAAELNPPPKLAIIFFRDYDFTNPALNLTGKKLREAYQFMKPGDEQIIELAEDTGGEPTESFMDSYLPEHLVQDMRRRISNWSLDVAVTGQPKGADSKLQDELNTLFKFANLRGEIFDAGAIENDLTTDTYSAFSANPKQNLLSRYIALGKEHNIKLCFYRVKRRPDKNNLDSQTPELKAYMGNFKNWVESQGCIFIDDTEDPRITLSMYGNGDHIAEKAMKEYTRDIFLERVKSILPTQTTAKN